MNKIKYLLLILLFAVTFSSCGGEDDEPVVPPQTEFPEEPDTPTEPNIPEEPNIPDTPDNPKYPVFETPEWNVYNYNEFEYSMTAFISISADANIIESENDKLAFFCSNECRGVAERIEVEKDIYVWMALIYGTNNNEPLIVNYYSSSNKHLYKNTSNITFKANSHIGDIDSPKYLNFEIVTSK